MLQLLNLPPLSVRPEYLKLTAMYNILNGYSYYPSGIFVQSNNRYYSSQSTNVNFVRLYARTNYLYYRIAGNFRGVLIFVIFVTIPRVTKFSTHEIFHPRIFSRLLRIGLRESRNLKPRKLILKTRDSFSRKFAPPKITRYTVFLCSKCCSCME